MEGNNISGNNILVILNFGGSMLNILHSYAGKLLRWMIGVFLVKK
jgi:hypothetical protein